MNLDLIEKKAKAGITVTGPQVKELIALIRKQEAELTKRQSATDDEQAYAWRKVCAALDSCVPDWLDRPENGTDCAVLAIKALAAPHHHAQAADRSHVGGNDAQAVLSDEEAGKLMQKEWETAQASLKTTYPHIAGNHKVFEVSVFVESGCDASSGEFECAITKVVFGWVGKEDHRLVHEAIWEEVANLNLPSDGSAQFIVYESGEREDVFWNSYYRVHGPVAAAAQGEASSDPIVEMNVAMLRQRSAVGVRKYGVTMADADLDHRTWLAHALEEGLDQVNYLQAAIQKLNNQGG